MYNIIFEVSPSRGCYNRDQLYFYLSFAALLPEHHLLQTFCIHLWEGTNIPKSSVYTVTSSTAAATSQDSEEAGTWSHYSSVSSLH